MGMVELSLIGKLKKTKANINSPILTGIPKAPTAVALTSTDQIATTAFVQQEVARAGGYDGWTISDGTNTEVIRNLDTFIIDGDTNIHTVYNTTTNSMEIQLDSTPSIDSVIFNGSPTLTNTIGEMSWNSYDSTIDIKLNNSVTLQVGQELHIYAKATEAISNGQVVMFAGAQGDHILISKATTTGLNTNSRYLVGVATQSFNANDFGYVTWFGKVNGINTSAWAEGSILYFNHSVVGGLTTTTPTAPNAKITVAAVLRQHATEGTLLIRPDLGSKLDDLHNVAITSGVSGDSLYFDGTKWINTPAYTKIQIDNKINQLSADALAFAIALG